MSNFFADGPSCCVWHPLFPWTIFHIKLFAAYRALCVCTSLLFLYLAFVHGLPGCLCTFSAVHAFPFEVFLVFSVCTLLLDAVDIRFCVWMSFLCTESPFVHGHPFRVWKCVLCTGCLFMYGLVFVMYGSSLVRGTQLC